MNEMIQRSKKNLKSKKGFTLIELIVVIAILGILAAILIPSFSGFQDRARATQALTDAKQIATAMDALFAEEGDWTKVTTAAVEKMAFGDTNLVPFADPVRDWVSKPDDDGGFKWGVKLPNGNTVTAGRATANDPVEMDPNATT